MQAPRNRHLVQLAALLLACTAAACGKSHPDCCQCSYSGSGCSGSATLQGASSYANCQEACEAQNMSCPIESAVACGRLGPDASSTVRRDSAVLSLPDSSVPPSNKLVCCATPSISYCNCYEQKTCDSDEVQVSACPNYGHCCQDQAMSDFCTCWDLSCSDTFGTSYDVPGCP